MGVWLLTIIQIGLPIAVITWIAFGRARSAAAWITATAGVVLFLVGEHLIGLWLLAPPSTPLILLMPVALALAFRGRFIAGRRWPTDAYGWTQLSMAALLLTVSVAMIGVGVRGRRIPAGATVDLTFPLRAGTYYVANGGSAQPVNAHLMTLDTTRFADYYGQSHGVDIVKLNAMGGRANGVRPKALTSYAIFGELVYAPCEGRVALTFDGAPDMMPTQRDRSHMAGNFVLVACGDAHVLLGHLQRGSVRVRDGQLLKSSDSIGRVGNSGNSDEPHLHVHAQLPPADLTAFTRSEPVLMRFDGTYLARNDRVIRTGGPQPSWTPGTMLYAQLGSSLAALLLLATSLRSSRAGRLLIALLFGYAAVINLSLSITHPRAYLDYAAMTPVALYRDFILGWFARHTTGIVAVIAIGQAAVALGALRRDAYGTAALVGAVVFLLAIAPLGTGSGFPATVIMAIAALRLLRP